MADIIWLHPIQMHCIRQWNEKQIKYIHLLFSTTGHLHTIHLAMAPQIAYVRFSTLQVRKSEPVPPNTPTAGMSTHDPQFCAMKPARTSTDVRRSLREVAAAVIVCIHPP